MIKKHHSIIAAAVAAIGLVAVSSDSALSAITKLEVPLKAMNHSGQNGTALFSQLPTGALVFITVQNPASNAEPAHIHVGKCPRPNRNPAIALQDIKFGFSKTFLPGVRISSLLHDTVVIHQSLANIGTYVSCGNIR